MISVSWAVSIFNINAERRGRDGLSVYVLVSKLVSERYTQVDVSERYIQKS